MTDSKHSKSPGMSFLLMLAPILALFGFVWGKMPLNDAPEYFAFIDGRACSGIPNAWNVLTNLPFIYVGLRLYKVYKPEGDSMYRLPGILLAVGMILTCFGSGYFHWNPNPETLFWDRLPMVIAFSGIFLLLVSDRFSTSLSRAISYPLLAISIGSVLYWKYASDLRPYAVLQFGLLLFTFMIAIFKKSNRISNASVFGMAGLYLGAKVLEHNDAAVFELLGEITSGHSLKHLFAAVAVWVFSRGFKTKITST